MEMGTTLVFETYQDILVHGSEDRELATALLRKYPLIKAIEQAALLLDADKRFGHAAALRAPLGPIGRWEPKDRETLRQAALVLLDQGKDIRFHEDRTTHKWGVSVDADGNMTISGPPELFCAEEP